ncbi:PEP-CTERM sorting domain-containing protein [Massilia sp. TN1-12]|uniref:PEP-CTERM sorting domain-containing protein n=1 Tax=Massilia paldalensis TaxID=3377675 RepID=UPI003850FC95
MIKLSALFATILFAAAGSANAGILLASGAPSYTLSTNSNTAVTLPLGSKQSGGLLVDFTFSVSKELQNNDFMAVYFGNSDGPNIGLKANCGGDTAGCTNDIFLRMKGTNGKDSRYVAGTDIKIGTDYHLFGYLYKTGDSTNYNAFDLWVNPTDAEMVSLNGADLHITGDTGIASFASAGIRTANLEDNKQVVTVTGLAVSEVPEPATLSLFGLAAAGMGFLRRRKQA